MPARSTCHAEVDRLHAFFVSWFTANADAEGFDSVEHTLDADFEMVTPDSTRRARDAVLDSVREAHGRHEPGTFDIDIRNVSLIQEMDSYATVRYEDGRRPQPKRPAVSVRSCFARSRRRPVTSCGPISTRPGSTNLSLACTSRWRA